MQPYFLPYIGYFQLMNAVDEFVIYDNIEYTKKGWINRNRILVDGKGSYISIPIKKDSDYLSVRERYISDSWILERKKILNKVSNSYKKAPYFSKMYPVIEKIILFNETNLFKFIFHSITTIKEILEIKTPLFISSDIPIDHKLKSVNKIIKIAQYRKANIYVNPIGGVKLYLKETFKEHELLLCFLKTNDFKYKQYENEYVPFLSILDVLMFNSKDEINNLIKDYYLI